MIFLTIDGNILSYNKAKNRWSDGSISLKPNDKNWPCLLDDSGELIEVEGHLIEDPTALQHLEGKREISYRDAAMLHFFFTLLYPFLWAMSKVHSYRIDRQLTLASKAAARNKIEKAAKHIEKSLALLASVNPRYRNSPGKHFEEEEDKESYSKS